MPVYVIPIVDDSNPLYCPAIPAALYLKSLRGRFNKSGWSHRRLGLCQSFARTLEQSTRTEDSDDEDTVGSDWILGNYYSHSNKQSLARRQHLGDSVTGELDHDSAQKKPVDYLASPKRFQSFSLKRKLCFSDLGAPPKYARSQPSFHDSSFDIDVQHEKLEYFSNTMESSPQTAPQHSRAERPNVETLADRLDSTLPGIRLRERLLSLTYPSPEAFMDFMSENGKSYDCNQDIPMNFTRSGHISRRVLEIFCDSEIKRISFTSAFNENGLNLCGHEFYSGGYDPNFLFFSIYNFFQLSASQTVSAIYQSYFLTEFAYLTSISYISNIFHRFPFYIWIGLALEMKRKFISVNRLRVDVAYLSKVSFSWSPSNEP